MKAWKIHQGHEIQFVVTKEEAKYLLDSIGNELVAQNENEERECHVTKRFHELLEGFVSNKTGEKQEKK